VLGLNVPFLEITKQLFPGWGALVYQVALALAIYTTGVSYCFTIGTRFSRFVPQTVENKVVRNTIPISFFVIGSVIVSQIGVMAIYNKLAPIMGYLNMIFLFLPLMILAPIAIARKRNELKSQGINPDEGDFITES
ncbi:MAG TPA: hypothetical protein GX733_03520, partial [Tissierellia bacterium]|nr:hypothetical protein [Tissierellia bacterium]